MKLPRNLSGDDLVKALAVFGYAVTRQTGSHLRMTSMQAGEHHITIPRHDPLRIGTLSAILSEVAAHFSMSREDVVARVFEDR